jgi:hypothetical protein
MDERNERLIRELAEQFGTTVEHLLDVLVRQAAISGTIKLVACFAWIAVVVLAYRLIRLKTIPPSVGRDYNPDNTAMAWTGWAIMTIMMLFFVGFNIEYIVSAFINPEYLALKQLLK